MELSFETAEKEARAEFGSVVIPREDGDAITLLTPMWIEDTNKHAQLEQWQERIRALQAEGEDGAAAGSWAELKRALVEMLAVVADKPDAWRSEAMRQPLAVVMTFMNAWHKAGQPGEA